MVFEVATFFPTVCRPYVPPCWQMCFFLCALIKICVFVFCFWLWGVLWPSLGHHRLTSEKLCPSVFFPSSGDSKYSVIFGGDAGSQGSDASWESCEVRKFRVAGEVGIPTQHGVQGQVIDKLPLGRILVNWGSQIKGQQPLGVWRMAA